MAKPVTQLTSTQIKNAKPLIARSNCLLIEFFIGTEIFFQLNDLKNQRH